jgi:hypothetical protein
MDLAANPETARGSIHLALAIYGVLQYEETRPRLDPYLSAPQKTDVLDDSYQLPLMLAETEAQSAPAGKPAEKEPYLSINNSANQRTTSRTAVGFAARRRGEKAFPVPARLVCCPKKLRRHLKRSEDGLEQCGGT